MNHAGLSSTEVAEKNAQGRVNKSSQKTSNTVGKIILRNILTIFNIVNIILAAMIIVVGSYKHLLFIFIAIANTLIGIVNEVRAKRTIDKMRLLAEQKPTVIRGGKPIQIRAEDVVQYDLLVCSLGDQIIVDSQIVEGTV